MDDFAHRLPDTLQRARRARRVSQLELSLRLGVSQRHVSFVESGRARPSRDLLTRWLGELDAPLALRNAALLQAGFAPAYRATTLDDPEPPSAHLGPQAPVLTLRFATPFGNLAFFRMFTTFGTPQDITLASLRVEHMFAADEATEAVVRAQVR